MSHLRLISFDQRALSDFVFMAHFLDDLQVMLIPSSRFHENQVMYFRDSNDELLKSYPLIVFKTVLEIIRSISYSSLIKGNLKSCFLDCKFVRCTATIIFPHSDN